jgi:hypothetical protein
MAETSNPLAGAQGQQFNPVQGLFSLADTGLKGYFATANAKIIAKAPAKNAGILVGGIIGVGILLVILFKH